MHGLPCRKLLRFDRIDCGHRRLLDRSLRGGVGLSLRHVPCGLLLGRGGHDLYKLLERKVHNVVWPR